jgi:hypothetical protein
MARTLIATSDYIVADGHPSLVDIKNRYIEELWTSFIAEHDENTGEHLAPYNSLGLYEVDTYSGTGASQTITFSGNLTSRTIKAVLIWSASTGTAYIRLDTMSTTKKLSGATVSDAITTLGTGSVTIGTSLEVNQSSVTYYMLAIGAGQTPDTGDASSAPSWIQHNIAMLGGNSATMANSVEDALDTSFQVQHTEAGVHDSTLAFAGVGIVETGTFTPDGTIGQVVTLTNDINIKFLIIAAEDARSPYFKSSSMSKIRNFTNAEITNASNALSLGQGQFIIDGTQELNQETFLDLQDQPDGSTSFPDSSSYSHTVSKYGSGTAEWTNSTAGEGTTSIKLINAFLTVSRANTLQMFNDFEFSTWLRLDSTDKPFGKLFQVSNSGDSDDWIYFELTTFSAATSTLTLVVEKTGESTQSTTTTTNVKDGAWHKIEIKSQDGQITIDVGGTTEGSVIDAQLSFDDPNIWIGSNGHPISEQREIDRTTLKRTPRIFSTQQYSYLVIGSNAAEEDESALVIKIGGNTVRIGGDRAVVA